MRQIHHWAALLFLAAIVVHLMRVFFTGAFRRPRELNWIIGVHAADPGHLQRLRRLLAARRPAVGHRACASPTRSRCRSRSAGTWLASLLFGGEFPGPDIINRLYVIHILLLPGDHRRAARRPPGHRRAPQAHPVRGARAGREDNVVGERGVADATRPRRSGSCFLTAAVLCRPRRAGPDQPDLALRPVRPGRGVSSASQPDWYMGWLDGALRLMPGWEIRAFGFEIPNPFFPGVLLAGITFGLLYAWPFLEARFTGDTPSTTCSTGPATGRCAPRSACATLTLLRGAHPGGVDRRDRHDVRPVGERGARRRSGSCCSWCRPSPPSSPTGCARSCQARDIADGIEPPQRRASAPSCSARSHAGDRDPGTGRATGRRRLTRAVAARSRRGGTAG